MNITPTSKWQDFKAWNGRTWRSGLWGKLKLIAGWYVAGCFAISLPIVLLVAITMPPVEKRPEIAQTQSSVVRTKTLYATSSADLEARKGLREVYNLAHENSQLERIRINYVMSANGVSDQYGNPLTEDRAMGHIEFGAEDLEEMRKYRTEYLYMDELRRLLYEQLLKTMPSGHLLRP
ncbi:hypothetical protein E9531_16870 [Lampropedia puyangensis]|uniref:Uncharacterized protein n=1 Tax=Lampropedia puyangensis TaxID=1330072 RepID=A0A4V4GQ18_9BURK|nr:hypothetical protein [Lampropedia puyangensis]THT96055.1 hypothetical protein E9531_16870 [Lampropedia puyangensis]